MCRVNGQLQWLVKPAGMDLEFQLVESRATARDPENAVKDIIENSKMVSDVKGRMVEIISRIIDLEMRQRRRSVTRALGPWAKMRRPAWPSLTSWSRTTRKTSSFEES